MDDTPQPKNSQEDSPSPAPNLQPNGYVHDDKSGEFHRSLFLNPLNLIPLIFIGSLIIGFILPSGQGGGYLVTGALGLGAFAALRLMVGEIRMVFKRTKNPFVQAFSILAGLGIGIVIFLGSVFAAVLIEVSKDPSALQCG
jgi:hypothetical protein